ncbi:hypothetical protein [Fodinicola feengrottensis]|uniref:hypothetical protein n=1 Tax=Fodinicola feengrottensis TaxID=435914 RepID=UPI0013D0E73C|nr:hypothetical protein [Fodinicola feengrottensis]
MTVGGRRVSAVPSCQLLRTDGQQRRYALLSTTCWRTAARTLCRGPRPPPTRRWICRSTAPPTLVVTRRRPARTGGRACVRPGGHAGDRGIRIAVQQRSETP